MTAINVRLHCVVCDNSLDYLKYLLGNYRSLASPDANIEVIAHCTDDASFRDVRAQNLADQSIAVHRRPEFYVYGNRVDIKNRIKLFLGGSPALSGSSGHAAGINSAFRMTGGGKMDIIADTDTAIVVPHWDRVLWALLQDYAMIGTSYEEKGGVTSGSSNTQTYKSAPNLTWIALSPRYDFTKLDASHCLWWDLPIRTQEDATIYGLEVGDNLLRDVGWKIPLYLYRLKAKAKKLVHAKPAFGQAKVLGNSNNYNEEFHLDGQPFILHQRGSRKHAFRSEPLSAPFYNAVETYLDKIKSA